MTDAKYELELLENELNALAPKNVLGAEAIINKAIALSIAVFGIDNPHAPILKRVKFYPYGTIQAKGQDISQEAWENGKAEFLHLSGIIKTEIDYKKKFPKPIEFPSKITASWILQNAPVSLIWKAVISIAVGATVIYSLGTRHNENITFMKSLISPPAIEAPKSEKVPHNKSSKPTPNGAA
ncbi:hypothetical protein [Pseudomonas sp. B392_1p]|uniref:hypothetical protein n=1 Tax=Pseudomonas sp. B392_1p TaxID=3457507 RepID=UPI003FD356D8